MYIYTYIHTYKNTQSDATSPTQHTQTDTTNSKQTLLHKEGGHILEAFQ